MRSVPSIGWPVREADPWRSPSIGVRALASAAVFAVGASLGAWVAGWIDLLGSGWWGAVSSAPIAQFAGAVVGGSLAVAACARASRRGAARSTRRSLVYRNASARWYLEAVDRGTPLPVQAPRVAFDGDHWLLLHVEPQVADPASAAGPRWFVVRADAGRADPMDPMDPMDPADAADAADAAGTALDPPSGPPGSWHRLRAMLHAARDEPPGPAGRRTAARPGADAGP